ncbi:hypothetical protein PG987_014582 [Apiospora arundinis]
MLSCATNLSSSPLQRLAKHVGNARARFRYPTRRHRRRRRSGRSLRRLAAAEHGATVLVLDAAHGGGSTAISGGVLYAGGGTQQQREAGYGYDTPDNMFRYLREEIGLNGPDAPVGEATLRRFCDESVARMDYPTDRYGLYFSGNERAHPYAAVAEPAPRGHRVVGEGATSGMKMTGNVLWEALYRSAVQMGVKFEFASRAKELLFDSSGTGAVQGVRYLAMDPATAGLRKA